MGEEQSDPAKLLLERQSLTLELDAVITKDMRPNVGLGGYLQIRVSEFEDDLWVSDWEAVLCTEYADAE